MKNNSAATAYGAKGWGRHKWLLLLCAASAAVVDIIIIAMLAAGGEGGEYLACPVILLIFDLFYFAVSLFFTDFRFKYSITVWLSYIVLYAVGFSIGLSIILGGEGTVLTDGALILWSCIHAFNMVCAVVCALYASRVIRKMWFALGFAALFVVGSVIYAGYMFADGFFGQGTGRRTIVYSYNKAAGTYAAVDVLSGRSGKVVIPETFNGKPVTALHCQLFTRPNISEVVINKQLEITGVNSLNSTCDFSNLTVKTDKDGVNYLRNIFYSMGVEHSGTVRANALALANATLPANLAENEGYVAFNYDAADFDTVSGNFIPVYVGDLSAFDAASYTAGYDYIAHREDGSGDNYEWAYNNGGYIFTDIAGGDGSVFNGVTKSTVAFVKFEKVYRIYVDEGNDKKYDMHDKQPELCYDTVNGDKSQYKYLTMNTAEEFLDGFTPRKGFTCRWLYYKNSLTQDGRYFTDLTKVLDDGITLSARWELKKPVLTVGTNAQNNTITYGDDIEISAQTEIEAEGVTPVYSWTFGDEYTARWTTDCISLTRPKATEYAGKYSLLVTLDGGGTTSLTEFATAEINLAINPKRLDLIWDLPQNAVYDGTFKDVSVSYDQNQLVVGDSYTPVLSGLSRIKNADTYNYTVPVDLLTLKNYDIRNRAASVTIAPRPVEVSWADYEGLIYNGSTQCPVATANGVTTDGALTVNVSGGKIHAGNYTATASIADTNYTVTNPARQFGISPKPMTAVVGDATVVYGTNSVSAKITYNAADFASGDDESVMKANPVITAVPALGDAEYRVGTFAEGVRCDSLNTNDYTVTVTYGELTITRRTVTINWNVPANLTYDGTAKGVSATVGNRVGNDSVTLTVSGGNGVTADTYTATVTAIGGADADNYKLPDTVTRQYTVAKRAATVVWNSPANPVYDGGEHIVTYTVQNLVAGDEQYLTESFVYLNAGEYDFSIASEYILTNYQLTNNTLNFTVRAAKGTADFYINRITYDDYDTAVRVGDTVSWTANAHIRSVTVYLNGEIVPDDSVGTGFIPMLAGSYEIAAAGDYVIVLDIGGEDNNTTRESVTLKMSGVLEREVTDDEN